MLSGVRWIAVVALVVSWPATGEQLTTRFLAREDVPLAAYVAARRLEARNERFKVEGWLEACVALSPDTGFHFEVTREGGSSYIRNGVLRKALDGERDVIASGEAARASLSPANYLFEREAAQGAMGEAGIRLTPRRKDGLLISGRLVVSDPEADLLRVEGRLAKSPSFWTKSVDVVRRYGWRGGIRVPIEMTSTADIRLAGRSTFRMTIDYVAINGATVFRADSSPSPCLVTQN
jgi:hypothetical protein